MSRLAAAAFDVDVAQRAQGHPSTGVETVQHALSQAVLGQLLLESPEDLRLDRFELEADLVADAAAALDAVAPLAIEPVGEQAGASRAAGAAPTRRLPSASGRRGAR